jgi:putative spermidine/putrescine transport system ATP-binding protein
VESQRTPAIRFVGIRKVFGDPARGGTVAVDSVDLEIGDGEFFSMLGPSGSGKTTMLRMVAGFETPSAGAILLDGIDVTHTPPFDRDVNTVFQDYALFPHMTVADNVAYGLMVKKVAKAERIKRVGDALDLVRLAEYGNRKPGQLSGGQRQRVALARALVNRPKVLLLDEPLGALDQKLREEMQVELKQLQREVGITFLFVTHDQQEALAMSDRIAVFNEGRIEQVGSPSDIYERPATSFVASFVGTTNTIMHNGKLATIRPERLALVEPGAGQFDGEISEVQYLGAERRVRVRLDNGTDLVVTRPGNDATATRGDRVGVQYDPDHLYHLPKGDLCSNASSR